MGQGKGGQGGPTAMMAGGGGMEESTSSADTAGSNGCFKQAKTMQAKSSPNLYNPLQTGNLVQNVNDIKRSGISKNKAVMLGSKFI